MVAEAALTVQCSAPPACKYPLDITASFNNLQIVVAVALFHYFFYLMQCAVFKY